MDCCSVYSDEFDREGALSDAQRYRRRGLDRVSAAVREIAIDHGVRDASVLEIGGGSGALSIELLLRGAAQATNVELSTSYRDAGTALALEAGVQDRIEMVARDGKDFVDGREFDILILNRVVCCYEDGLALLRAAALATRRLMVVSHPTIHVISRFVVGIGNRIRRRQGSEFRAYVHPDEVLAQPAEQGLSPTAYRRRPVWTVRAWSRDLAPI